VRGQAKETIIAAIKMGHLYRAFMRKVVFTSSDISIVCKTFNNNVFLQ
jgi:hypothetical protein